MAGCRTRVTVGKVEHGKLLFAVTSYFHNDNVYLFRITLFLFAIKEVFSNHPVPLSKEGSTFSPSPSSSGSGDVAGDAIALPEFWYRQRSLCPQGAADDCLRNRVAIVCAVLYRLGCRWGHRLAWRWGLLFRIILFLFAIKEFFSNHPVPLSKEGSTSFPKPFSPQGTRDVTALRCSEPLRYKVGGPIKGLARLCGLGPPGVEWGQACWDRLAKGGDCYTA